MKKLLITCALIVAGVTAYGQGRVNFANPSGATTAISTNTQALPGGTIGVITGAGNFYFGLYVGVPGSTSNQLTLNILGTNGGFNGRMAGPSTGALLAPFAPGQTLAIQVRGWSAAGGLSYEAALIAQQSDPTILAGASNIGSVTSTESPAAAATMFGAGVGQITAFQLTPNVPEPSSIALGLLGLGAIAMFRRRK